MTQEEINKRIKAIEQLQKNFNVRVQVAESNLYTRLISDFDAMRKKLFPTFKKVWNSFIEADYIPLIESFVKDMNSIVDLNQIYFGSDVPKTALFDRLGVTGELEIVKDGYVSTIIQDQSAKREVQLFLNRTKSLKADQRVKEDLSKLIRGEKAQPATKTSPAITEKPGVIQKFTDNNVNDSYNEADRIIQQDQAVSNNMTAMMYTGGVIGGSRPFCIERNRKVFLMSEIALFGTAEDKFGGYTNKAQGLFAGKPKTGYDPFTQLGGYNCRHHLSALADEYAIRVDKTLKIENDKLVRI